MSSTKTAKYKCVTVQFISQLFTIKPFRSFIRIATKRNKTDNIKFGYKTTNIVILLKRKVVPIDMG